METALVSMAFAEPPDALLRTDSETCRLLACRPVSRCGTCRGTGLTGWRVADSPGARPVAPADGPEGLTERGILVIELHVGWTTRTVTDRLCIGWEPPIAG